MQDVCSACGEENRFELPRKLLCSTDVHRLNHSHALLDFDLKRSLIGHCFPQGARTAALLLIKPHPSLPPCQQELLSVTVLASRQWVGLDGHTVSSRNPGNDRWGGQQRG